MKAALLLEILKTLRSNAVLWKRVKIFFVIGFVGFLSLGGLVIWAGASAVKYAVSVTNKVVLDTASRSQFNSAMSELQQTQLQPLSCWEQAQSLLSIQPWLESPALDNFSKLKSACFRAKGEVI